MQLFSRESPRRGSINSTQNVLDEDVLSALDPAINTTVLTPGGDIIREMIGAFPAATLAEGEYVAIARHDNKTYQSTFKVESGVARDVEVPAKETPPPEAP
jgi:hypothetical protein